MKYFSIVPNLPFYDKILVDYYNDKKFETN